MIAEHREPKGLRRDTPALGSFQEADNFRDDAERGSAMLRDAILEKHFGIVIPKAEKRPTPLRRAELCPTCLGPVRPPPRMIAGIQQTVAAYFGVPVVNMTGNSRRREISHARQIAMYLATELCRHSIADIGRRFKKDHTTVLHAMKAVKARCESDEQLAFDVALLRERLSA